MPRLPVDVYKPCVFSGPMSPQGIQSFAVGDGGFRERNNLGSENATRQAAENGETPLTHINSGTAKSGKMVAGSSL